MPLLVPALQRDLAAIAKNPPRTPLETAKKWADAYASYASKATSGLGGNPVSVDAARAVLQAALAQTFATSRVAPQTAAQMTQSFTAFWMTPPLAFTGAFPGLVTGVLGAPALTSGLLSTWLSNVATPRMPADAAMAKVAAVLDVFTRTVIVTHATVPTPTPSPIV